MSKETKSKEASAHEPYTPSADQISAWKKKYGDVFKVSVSDSADNLFNAFFKKPNRKELSRAMAAGKESPMKFNDTLFLDCWIEGDEAIKTDDAMYLAACSQLATMVEVREAEIVKL